MTVEQIKAFEFEISRAEQPILEPILKLGGAPVFMRETALPACKRCGQIMDFLGQIPLDRPVSFLPSSHMAYIFMCPGHFDERGWLKCETWDPYAGANKVIIQENSGNHFVPEIGNPYPDYEIRLREIYEPDIDTSEFFLEDGLKESVTEQSKIGGVPLWLHSNDSPTCPKCDGLMRFVLQLGAELDGMLPARFTKHDIDYYKFFHFGGDDGIGYMFLCQAQCSLESAVLLWQST